MKIVTYIFAGFIVHFGLFGFLIPWLLSMRHDAGPISALFIILAVIYVDILIVIKTVKYFQNRGDKK